jgi:hypothetical protein
MRCIGVWRVHRWGCERWVVAPSDGSTHGRWHRRFASFWTSSKSGTFGQPDKGCSSNQVGFFQFLISGALAGEINTSELLGDQLTTARRRHLGPQRIADDKDSVPWRQRRGRAGRRLGLSSGVSDPTNSARSHHHGPPPFGEWLTRIGRRVGESVGIAHLPTVCYNLSQKY